METFIIICCLTRCSGEVLFLYSKNSEQNLNCTCELRIRPEECTKIADDIEIGTKAVQCVITIPLNLFKQGIILQPLECLLQCGQMQREICMVFGTVPLSSVAMSGWQKYWKHVQPNMATVSVWNFCNKLPFTIEISPPNSNLQFTKWHLEGLFIHTFLGKCSPLATTTCKNRYTLHLLTHQLVFFTNSLRLLQRGSKKKQGKQDAQQDEKWQRKHERNLQKLKEKKAASDKHSLEYVNFPSHTSHIQKT